MMSKPETILVIGPAWIGDMIMTQSLFKVLKLQNPAVIIDVLAPAMDVSLVQRMPEVRHGIISPFKHGENSYIERYQMGKELRNAHYDQVIFIPNSFKSLVIPLAAKIPRRTGWNGKEWPRESF